MKISYGFHGSYTMCSQDISHYLIPTHTVRKHFNKNRAIYKGNPLDYDKMLR